MRRKIPSTAALTAFEAAARHQSFTLAAEELSLTQSAVCRQVGSLEDFLGVKLFGRTRRGVMLTDAGATYSQAVRLRLDEFERDTLATMSGQGSGLSLELGVVPTFATRWLMPRLPDFAKQHPGVTVHMTTRVRPFLFDDSPLDAALFASTGGWPGTEATFVLPERLIAVASPALVGDRGIRRAADIAKLPLLHQATRPYSWRQWFAACGLEVSGDLNGPRMDLFSMLAEAASQGLGAALVPDILVEGELADGRLVQLTKHELESDRSYFLIYPPPKALNPALVAFREWLLALPREAS